MTTYRKELLRHMRYAHDPSQRKYKCEMCGKSYLNKTSLNTHKAIHTNVKSYKVDFSSFYFKYILLSLDSYQTLLSVLVRASDSEHLPAVTPSYLCEYTRFLINIIIVISTKRIKVSPWFYIKNFEC